MACAEQVKAGRQVMDERTKRATQLCVAFMRLLDEEGFWLGDCRAFEKPPFAVLFFLPEDGSGELEVWTRDKRKVLSLVLSSPEAAPTIVIFERGEWEGRALALGCGN